MPARTRLIGLLPWLLCASAVMLMGLAAFLRVTAGGAAAGQDVVASVLVVAGFASFPVVGAVIAGRLPGNPYGWVWCALGVALGVVAVSFALAESRALASPAVTMAGYLGFLGLAGLLVFVFLLFPTGRPPSRRWRWLSWATALLGLLLAVATPFAPFALDSASSASAAPGGAAGRLLTNLVRAGAVGMVALVLVAMASLVSRFLSARPLEQQQLKWFVMAAAVNGVFFLVDLVTGISIWTGGWVLTHVLTASLVPAAVGIAVLRYRLYEIDRIISRSVSYILLTGGLVVLYLVVVAVLRPLLEPLTGSSALAVAGSTLAVAAVFNPARRRLQAAVDRRFDRARYDAARAVDAFAARLRNQVDLDEVTAGLRDTVVATVAPTRVTVWLRVPSATAAEP